MIINEKIRCQKGTTLIQHHTLYARIPGGFNANHETFSISGSTHLGISQSRQQDTVQSWGVVKRTKLVKSRWYPHEFRMKFKESISSNINEWKITYSKY